MVERIPQHRHCKNCDKAVPFEKEFCDEKCETDFRGTMKKKKKQLQMFYILMVIIFIFALSLSLFGR